jgi:ATP-dependent helicase/nuclease subunit A
MTSILSLLQFKGRQSEAASAPDGAIAVTAGAGSGKTRALAGRFLALLEAGLPLRSLIAITFTEKAAREMRTRIRGFIERWLAEAPDGVDRTLWGNAFSELDAARIGTIHSLCAQVLRAHPAAAAVDPAFEVLDENAAAVLQARAVEGALAWALTDPSTARLLGPLTEYQARQAITTLLDHRLDARPALAALSDDPLAAWSAALAGWLDARLTACAWSQALDTLTALQARQASDKLEIARRALLAAWRDVQTARAAGDWDACFAALLGLRSHVRTGGAKANWDAGNLATARETMRGLRDHFDGELAPLLARHKPPAWSLDRQVAALLPALRLLFERTLDIYQALKDETHALDFDDLESRAADLLTHHPAVRARWGAEVQAVLVDEFQDTNERQRQIVYALTGFDQRRMAHGAQRPSCVQVPGMCSSLFVVGDAKQSIYRFRGADVTVFRRVQDDVAAAGGKHVDLDLTFRAHRPLVEVTNALLAPILGAEGHPAPPYQVPFAPLRAYRQSPRAGFAGPYVEFHLGLGEDAAAGRRAAACALAARLLELRERESSAWKDVALLFRASRAFPIYEDALERAGVPFVTVAGRGFYDRPEVRDLLNALTAIADPSADLSLAGLLRSPACALSDAALYLLRRGPEPGGRRRSLWRALNGDLSALLSPRDAEQGRRARETITALHELVGRVPVAAVLKQLLDLTHYRAALRLAGGGRALRNVDKLLADAHRSGLVGVSEFLEYVQSLRDVGARESEAPTEATEGEGAVQLMTVHKAKGLEFPVVVVADAAHAGAGRAGAVLIDPQWGVSLDLRDQEHRPAMHRLAALRQAEMEEAESKRLLYVAATRAREKLIVSGHVKVSAAKKEPGRLLLGGWLAWLGAVVGLDQVRLPAPPRADETQASTQPAPVTLDLDWDGASLSCVVHPLIEPAAPVLPPSTTTAISTIQAPAHPPALIAPLVSVEGDLTDEKTRQREREPPPRVWRVVPRAKRPTGPAWVVGQLVHVALRYWRFPDRDDFELFMHPYALEAGLTDPREIANTVSTARRHLARFQTHPLYAEMSAAERYHEVPFSLPGDDGRTHNGVIDALYRAPSDGAWVVAEFKTDEIKTRAEGPTELATVLDEHLRREKYDQQVEVYVKAVTQLLGERPRALIVFLNAGGEVRVVPDRRPGVNLVKPA